MSAQDLIVKLQNQDVELWVENDKLRYSAPPGVMSEAQLQLLVDNKQAVIDWLQSAVRSRETDIQPIPVVSREQALLASFAQERLWFLDQLEPGNLAYIIPLVSRLRGELQVDTLIQSLLAITVRHEALRTRFLNSPSGPLQIIDDEPRFELEQEDLSGLNAEDREREVQARIQSEKMRPFDLANDSLIRGRLLRLAEDEHVLLLMLHHVVADGWSMAILMKELASYYSALVQASQPSLPDLPVQYADFAAWQRQWLSGAELEKQLDYWRTKLSDSKVLELPTDRARPVMLTSDGALEMMVLDAKLSEQLERLGKDSGVTLFMTLLTVFMVMLYRYSGQSDIAVGTPIASRNRTELEGLIAFFVNMLVLRVDCEGNPDFNTLVKRVSETTLGAYEHQDIPFEKLVEVLQVERDPSRNPLFQVQFALQNVARTIGLTREAVELPGLTLEPVINESQVARFDLESHVWINSSNELQISFVYNTNLFDATTIRRMQRHFANLLAAVVAEPGRPIDQLPMLDADERGLLEQWSQAPSDYPHEQTVQALFEQQVQASPDAIAAEYQGESLSYAEVNARANQVAHTLQTCGVGPEVVVGICIERSLEMLVALLGILKAGGAYLPLDPEYPQSRLDFMLADSAAPVLLTLSSFTPQFDAFTGRTICLDRDWAEISQESTDNPDSGATAESLIYVIYTSGSTGVPKGTLIEQRSAVRLVQNTNFVELGADEVFLQFAPISFDASTFELWGSLLNGARLVIFPAGRSSLEELGEVIRDRGVTTLWLTSALFSQMVDNHRESLRGVRQLLAGGEALSLPHVRKMIDNLGENRLINGYGPTENTTFTCCHVMTRDSELGQSVPIGRPISNTTVYILDKSMNPVPVGVAGELYIGGDGLARGYLNQAELTAQKFVANPFSDDQDARLYRTGDQVRYRDDGSIEFLGRIDQQVKVRGYRIELGEIETALAQQEAVSEAVAIVREDESGDKRIIAYVVPTPAWRAQHPEEGAADESGDELIPELREQLREQLPSYMVPSLFMVLEALPLNANDKVDRAALPDPDADRAGLEVGYVAPRTELETQLAQIWAEVLKLEQVGIHDNFFDLGGHSLMATQVVSRVRDQLKAEFPLSKIFSYPTVAELTPEIQKLIASEIENEPISLVPRDSHLPLSFAQERLWFLDQLQPGNPAYIIPLALFLKGELLVDVLVVSLNTIVARHEALRTRFVSQPGGPVQVIDDEIKFNLVQSDLTTLAGSELQQEIVARLQVEKAIPFDLASDVLIRGKLLRLNDHEHVLFLTMHHIIADGWSLGVLFRELAHCYSAFSRKEQPRLAELPIQYADFSIWQRQWLSGAELDKQLDYWRNQLGNLQILDLPTDRIRPTLQTFDGAHSIMRLDGQQSSQLRQFCKDAGGTLFMIMLAAYMMMLQRHSGQDDIVIGTPIANRNRSELENLIAVFVNMLVMRVDCSGNPSFNTLVKRVSEVALGAYEHQDIPFEKLVDELEVGRDPSRNPLFQVLFVVQNAPLEELQLGDLTLNPIASETHAIRFDLECHVSDQEEEIQFGFVYNTNLFDAQTIECMQQHYVNLLTAAVAEPHKPIDSMPMLNADEKDLILRHWNDTHQDYPDELTLAELFEAQVLRDPDAIALEFENESLSYGELNDRANLLACQLQEEGVGPERLVGVYMLRSLEMVIALYAIMKSGGAYVPLDPEYPEDRIAYMVNETELTVILTQAHLQQELPEFGASIICVDNQHLQAGLDRAVIPVSAATADNLAYVIYTSGSTGRPKGVMNTHRGIVNRLLWMKQTFPLQADDRVLQKTTFSFDVSVWEFFWPLITGARLIIAKPDGHKDPRYLSELIRDSKISNLHFVPSMLKVFLDNTDPGDFSGVKRVFCSGEGLPYDLQQEFFKLHTAQLHNLYGPTEAAIEVSHWECLRDDARQVVPMGRPTANTQLYILDQKQQPVPIGVSGELHIGGVQVARGYLGQPELTAEKFIADPFSDRAGAQLYKTGDLTRYLTDGTIEYVGRIDNQIKLRGLRIELGEIETVLMQHPSVREVAVICRDDDLQGQRLVAYLVAGSSIETLVDELRNLARTSLPVYMLPSAFVVLDSFPLLANGKLDRKAFPAPEGRRQFGEGFVEPRSDLERQLSDIWCKVLKLERVGIHDNFFDLGGHSLMVIQVVGYVRDDIGVTIDVVDLFSYPTVSTLAENILKLDSSEVGSTDAAAKDDNQSARKERMQQLRKQRKRS